MRLIDADELKPDMKVFLSEFAEELTECYSQIKINNATTIEAEPVKHGKWECVNQEENVYMCCGADGCGWEIKLEAGNPIGFDMHYCPNCGAKMEGIDKNE